MPRRARVMSPLQTAKGTAEGPSEGPCVFVHVGVFALAGVKSNKWDRSPYCPQQFASKKAEGTCASPPPRWLAPSDPAARTHALPWSVGWFSQPLLTDNRCDGVCTGGKVTKGSGLLSPMKPSLWGSRHPRMRTLGRQPKERPRWREAALPELGCSLV